MRFNSLDMMVIAGTFLLLGKDQHVFSIVAFSIGVAVSAGVEAYKTSR